MEVVGPHRGLERYLSKLVNLRAARKTISDARTATYVMLRPSPGPGGRRFKSFRPDQSYLCLRPLTRIINLQNEKVQRAPSAAPGGRGSDLAVPPNYFSSQFIALRGILLHDSKLRSGYIGYNIGGVSRYRKPQDDFVVPFSSVLTSSRSVKYPTAAQPVVLTSFSLDCMGSNQALVATSIGVERETDDAGDSGKVPV